MSNTENFFEQAENHSKIKHIVLEKFFLSWVNKVFYNKFNKFNNKLIVFDGFAGPGEYENGDKCSPIICLDTAFKVEIHGYKINDTNNKKMKILLLFCEKDKEKYNLLCKNIGNRLHLDCEKETYKKYSAFNQNIEVGISNKDFCKCFEAFTEKRKSVYENNPCFAFIDPFGYKDVTLESIINFFKSGKKTDLIFNMMYEHFNRFITVENEHLNNTHKKFLGATDEELEELQKNVLNVRSRERIDIITNFYKSKLEQEKLYVSKLEIKKENKVKMILFYITKNLTGFNLFKKIKFDIEYSLEQNNQLLLMTCKDNLKNELKIFLKENFYPNFKFNDVLEIVKKHDIFIEEIYRNVLQEMRKNFEIEIYLNGKKDMKALNTTEIKFVERDKNEQKQNRMDRSNLESNNRLF